MTFKQLIRAIRLIVSEEDRVNVCAQINSSFESGRISWEDHELLYDLACMVRVPRWSCRYFNGEEVVV